MPDHLKTKDTIEKRGDKYVLVSASGEVLGEHDSEAEAQAQERAIEAAKGEKSFDSLMAEAIKSGQLPEAAKLLVSQQQPIIIGPHNYSADAKPYVPPDPETDPFGAVIHKELRSAMEELRPKLAPVDRANSTVDSEEWVDTIDFAPFSRVDSRDANGFLRVSATVTKPGVYAYVRNGKIRHELKPASEIFAPVHMESVHGAVVTSEHPPGAVAVTPENSKKFQRGHSMSAPTRTADGLVVALVVTDQELIDDAESGRRTGVSEGMRNTFDHTSGIWTAPDGSKHPYDVIQTNMVANHLAIVKQPRVTSAQLHLDSLEQDGLQETNTMEKQATLTIDGADFEIDANVASIVKAHLGRADKKLEALQAKLDEATTSYDSLTVEKDKAIVERDTVSAERDTAHAERDALKEKLATADALDINELVTKRQAFLEKAKSVMTSDHFDEVNDKTDLEIMKHACEKSGAVMTEDSDAYLRARFDGLVDRAATTNDSKLMEVSLTMPAVTPTQSSERNSLNERLNKHRAGPGGQATH